MMSYVDSDLESHDHLPIYAGKVLYYSLFFSKCEPTKMEFDHVKGIQGQF